MHTLRSSKTYCELEKKNLSRFFDYLSTHHNAFPNPYGLSRVVYYLTPRTILGPKIAQILTDAAYDWVLKDDEKSNKIYAFFCDPTNTFLPPDIFEKMKLTGFVISE